MYMHDTGMIFANRPVISTSLRRAATSSPCVAARGVSGPCPPAGGLGYALTSWVSLRGMNVSHLGPKNVQMKSRRWIRLLLHRRHKTNRNCEICSNIQGRRPSILNR